MAVLPSQQRVRQLLDYSAATGELVWRRQDDRTKTWNTRFAGKLAGCDSHGYVVLNVDGKRYPAHRIIWVWIHGNIPTRKQIDHINGDRADNRLSNLRLATVVENTRNGPMRKRNRAGLKGVSFHAFSGLWRARIFVEGKERSLGYFTSPEEAHEAYVAEAKRCFGEFARAS